MQKQEQFDRSYHFFEQQIRNHHNSEPFQVKCIGEFALTNVRYLLARAELDLNVYFKREK